MIDWRDVKSLLTTMREARCLKLKTADVELELSPLAFALPDRSDDLAVSPSNPEPIGIENGGEPTEEQLLNWSVPGPLPPARQT